jgi:hypothetical protein
MVLLLYTLAGFEPRLSALLADGMITATRHQVQKRT